MKSVHPMICGIGSILIAVCLGCASTQPTVAHKPVVGIDRSELVGTWDGNRQSPQGTFRVEIEIHGEDLKGKATYYRVKTGSGTGTWTENFQARLEGDQLWIEWDQTHWVRLRVIKPEGGRAQLRGEYKRGKAEGSMLLEKR